MSNSNKADKDIPDDGAAALLSLFQPQDGAKRFNDIIKTISHEEDDTAVVDVGSKLMEMFQSSGDVVVTMNSMAGTVQGDGSLLTSPHEPQVVAQHPPHSHYASAKRDDSNKGNPGASRLISLFDPPADEMLLPSRDESKSNTGSLTNVGDETQCRKESRHARSRNNTSVIPIGNDSTERCFMDEAQRNPVFDKCTPAVSMPSRDPSSLPRLKLERDKTEQRNNYASRQARVLDQQNTPLLADEFWHNPTNLTFPTPHSRNGGKLLYESIPAAPPLMEPILEDVPTSRTSKLYTTVSMFTQQHLNAGTFLGGFIFLLYHIVFCLAMGSTISAGNLGIMAKMAASGVIFLSPIYIIVLGDEIPSQYPTTDLFLAPFMAKLAVIANETLSNDPSFEDKDHVVFLSTFAVLTSIGALGSGVLIMLATTFKLANLGSFLPFPVLCGFFSAVGVLMWTLALGVDTGGNTVLQVIGSFDTLFHALAHHLPSFLAGTMMKMYGPTNPFFSTYTIAATVIITYSVMFVTHTSLDEARDAGWFWTHDDLMPPPNTGQWLPPAPFGVLFALRHVHWGAIRSGLKTTTALSFLYLMRCSLHATALKKNVSNLKRAETRSVIVTTQLSKANVHEHHRHWTEDIDLEVLHTKEDSALQTNSIMTCAKIPTVPLQKVLVQYGYVQFLAAALGSFSVTPAVAAMDTMYKLGAEKRAPQLMSLLLLLVFYVTDFRLVAYIPKMSFSCLIVLSCLDMISTWFVESFYKTKEKAEWFVVPVIVVCSFVLGLLNSVFIGIAISTFIFVAAFFRSGVVKYLANCLLIRSTIERSLDASEWLDRHGDKIQVMVLQNYLFFGNASSMLNYVSTMFEDVPPGEDVLGHDLMPLPKYIIVDLTLVTGMDTSTVAIFTDIKTVSSNHGAKLFVSGLSIPLRETLALGNFKPERGERSQRNVRFFSTLDAAIGKAEDCLLEDEMIHNNTPTNDVFNTHDEAGSFEQAIRAIDEQHGLHVGKHLIDLFEHTTPIVLMPGDHLYASQGGPVLDDDRGLSFLACGLLKIERDSNVNATRNSMSIRSMDSFSIWRDNYPLSDLQARGRAMGEGEGRLKAGLRRRGVASFIRLARVGPGWVAGSLESAIETDRHVAVSRCKLHHLPHHKIEKIQVTDPVLILRLYKLLSHLTAKRQEVNIGQLMTLHSIMTSPAAGKPIRRHRTRSSS